MPDWTNATGMQLRSCRRHCCRRFRVPKIRDAADAAAQSELRAAHGGQRELRYAVFQVLIEPKAKNWLGQLVKAARQENPGNTKLKALDPLADLTRRPRPAAESSKTSSAMTAGLWTSSPGSNASTNCARRSAGLNVR